MDWLGYIVIVLGGSIAARSFYKLFRWHKAYGTVIDMVGGTKTVGEHNAQQMMWSPKVEFTDRNGNLITFVSAMARNRKNFRIGQTVRVLYSHQDSNRAGISSYSNLWMVPVFLICFGVCWIWFEYIGGFLVMIFHRL